MSSVGKRIDKASLNHKFACISFCSDSINCIFSLKAFLINLLESLIISLVISTVCEQVLHSKCGEGKYGGESRKKTKREKECILYSRSQVC